MKLIVGRVGSGKSQKVIEIAKEHVMEDKLVLIVTSLAKELEERLFEAEKELGDRKSDFVVANVKPKTSSNPELAVVRSLMPIFGGTPDVIMVHAEVYSRNLILALKHLEPVLGAEIYLVVQANADFPAGVQIMEIEEVLK